MNKRSNVFTALALAAAFLAGTALYAEDAPKKILAAKDIDAFIANFETLNADLDAVGDKYDDVFKTSEDAGPAQILKDLRKVKVPQEIKDILKKNGLGENGFEKLMVITIGFSAIEMEKYLDAQREQYAQAPDAQEFIDQSMAQVKEIKTVIHKDDLALLTNKREALYPVLMSDAAAGENPDGDGGFDEAIEAPGDEEYYNDSEDDGIQDD